MRVTSDVCRLKNVIGVWTFVVLALGAGLTPSPAAAQTTTTVTLAWDRNTDEFTAGYFVRYGTASGNYTESVDAGTQVSVSLSLNRGAVYFVSVSAYTSTGLVGPGSNEVSVDLRTGAPTATFSATLASPGMALVTWQTAGAVSATINGIAVGLSGSANVPIAQTTTFTLVAVSPAGVEATWTATVNPGGGTEAPSAQIFAGLASDYVAHVAWSTHGAAAATINGQPVPLSGSVTLPLTEVSNTFTLVATSASGATVTQQASTLLNPGPATAQISATWAGAGLARVAWQTSNAVAASVNGVPVALVGSATVPASPGARFTLVATNAARSTTTQETTLTEAAVPGMPRAVAAAVSGTRVTLSWQPPESGAAPEHYLVSVGTQPGLANILDSFAVGNVLSVSGDLPLGRYYVQVRAATAAGVSDAGTTAVRIGRTLPMPTALTAAWRGSTVVLSWTAPAVTAAEDQPTGYVLEAGTAPGLSNVAVVPVGAATHFEAVVPPGTYYVRVRAVNSAGDSDATADIAVTPPALQ